MPTLPVFGGLSRFGQTVGWGGDENKCRSSTTRSFNILIDTDRRDVMLMWYLVNPVVYGQKPYYLLHAKVLKTVAMRCVCVCVCHGQL